MEKIVIRLKNNLSDTGAQQKEHSQKSVSKGEKKLTQLDKIVLALEELGGKASYHDIYEKYEKMNGIVLSNSQKAGIRKTIETHSKDSKNFAGKDIFYSVNGKGSGVWGLNSMK